MSKPDKIPYRIQIALEYLPSCDMNLRKAAVKAGYSPTYAQKLIGRFARERQLREALSRRIGRLLEEAGESDREVITKILQRQHFDAHRATGVFVREPKYGILAPGDTVIV